MTIHWLTGIRCKRMLLQCFNILADLQQLLFYCYIKPDFIAKQAKYTKQLFKVRYHYLQRFQKARRLILPNSHQDYAQFQKIEKISEIIFSLHQLRYRVEDYTTFKLCKKELLAIANTSVSVLRARNTIQYDHLLAAFYAAVQEFSGLYERTLQVVARNPIVFLFFIQDLYALHDILSRDAAVESR